MVEIADAMLAQRAYEANLALVNITAQWLLKQQKSVSKPTSLRDLG